MDTPAEPRFPTIAQLRVLPEMARGKWLASRFVSSRIRVVPRAEEPGFGGPLLARCVLKDAVLGRACPRPGVFVR